MSENRALLLACLDAAIRRVQGEPAVKAHLELNPVEGRRHIVAVGKAACSMASGAMQALEGQYADVLIITKYGHSEFVCGESGVQCIEAAHPVPDEASLEAGQKLTEFLDERHADRFLFLISGGASSLVERLPEGIGLEQLAELTRWLLGSGLSIQEMNQYRRSLSLIKGGKLLAHIDRPELSDVLLISDVLGDNLETIGSGLCFPVDDCVDTTILPETIRSWWPGKPPGAGDSYPPHQVVASLSQAMQAAADYASDQGKRVYLHSDPITEEAGETGRALAEALCSGLPSGLHIWGGETTVRLPDNPGRGGRNQHLALSAAVALEGISHIQLLSAGTDGTDGPGEDAGAIVDGQTVARVREAGLNAEDCLVAADSGSCLQAAGDLLYTGPTGTNVMDVVIAWRGEE